MVFRNFFIVFLRISIPSYFYMFISLVIVESVVTFKLCDRSVVGADRLHIYCWDGFQIIEADDRGA